MQIIVISECSYIQWEQQQCLLNDVFICAMGVFVLLLLYIVFRTRFDYKENSIVSDIMLFKKPLLVEKYHCKHT